MAPRLEPELFLYDTSKALRPPVTRVRFDDRADKLGVDEISTSAVYCQLPSVDNFDFIVSRGSFGKSDIDHNLHSNIVQDRREL
jgi:hypothetical protein